MGDASDNIPGIPGIGEKTAIKLLSAYGTLENALDHAEADLKGKQREKMIDGAHVRPDEQKNCDHHALRAADDVTAWRIAVWADMLRRSAAV